MQSTVHQPHPSPLLMRPRFVVAVAIGIAIVGCLAHTAFGYSAYDLSGHAIGSDDAWISYRYAWNLSHGNGLVFNPGEAVEGFSNLLYVLLLSAVFFVAGDVDIYKVSVALNTAAVATGCWLFWRHVRAELGPKPALWAAFFFGLAPMFWLWAASGLETTVVLLFQLGIWFAVERARATPDLRSGLYLALWSAGLIVLRADGFLMPLAAAVYLMLHGRRRSGLGIVATVVVTQGLLSTFRLHYYGFPLPNSYYAKIAGPVLERVADALERLGQGVVSSGMLAAVVVVVVALVWAARRRDLASVRFSLIFPCLAVAYWLYIGGDHFFERFLIVLYPMGALAVLRLLHQGGVKGPAWAFVGLLLIGMQLGPLAIDPRFNYTRSRYDRWVELGTYLGQTYPGKRLATDASGKIPYFSGLYTIDTLGLNDTHIARVPVHRFRSGHSKFDPQYVLSREPDLITGWIEPNLDLKYGMDRALYRPAGYRVTHLVNTRARAAEANIVNTRGKSGRDISLLVASGYRYGVLVRGPAPGDP